MSSDSCLLSLVDLCRQCVASSVRRDFLLAPLPVYSSAPTHRPTLKISSGPATIASNESMSHPESCLHRSPSHPAVSIFYKRRPPSFHPSPSSNTLSHTTSLLARDPFDTHDDHYPPPFPPRLRPPRGSECRCARRPPSSCRRESIPYCRWRHAHTSLLPKLLSTGRRASTIAFRLIKNTKRNARALGKLSLAFDGSCERPADADICGGLQRKRARTATPL